MRHDLSFALSGLLLLAASFASKVAVATEADSGAPGDPRSETEAASFGHDLLRARSDLDVPFDLAVHCDDEDGFRSFVLHPSGVGVWNGRVQVGVDDDVRRRLVDDLLAADFPSFEGRYGVRALPGEAKAPLRIVCRVSVRADGSQKASVMAADGERFAGLADLANGLLDRIEPLAANGVTAPDLASGLAMIAGGELAPETLGLRVVHLPAPSSDDAGFIYRIEGGEVSRQAYRPGASVGEPEPRRLPAARARELARALVAADFTTLPSSVPGDSYDEMAVEVLGHRHAVIARPQGAPSAGGDADTVRRMSELLEALAGDSAGP